MKNLFKSRFIALFCVLNFISLSSFAGLICFKEQANLFEEISFQTASLRKVVEAAKEKENLMKADIKYGFIGLNVGKATIYLNTSEGKIVDLNVDADVNVVGLVKEKIQQKITLGQIKRGDPLKFQMAGSNRGVLIVQPGKDMNENGGSAVLKIWDGSKYSLEKIMITRVNGRFQVNKVSGRSEKKITGLSVTMGGTNVSKMYVSKYKIKTK
ncbi:MAG: hypothetical protein ACJAT2_000567 [Bacteriovoracaceae bacterium]|jgi:hypothetical protein